VRSHVRVSFKRTCCSSIHCLRNTDHWTCYPHPWTIDGVDQLLAIRGVFASRRGRQLHEGGGFASECRRRRSANSFKTLEAHLGVQLLSRTTRRVAVTPEGAAYYEKSARVMKELEDIDASLSAAKGRHRGHLRVDVGSSVASRLLLPALPAFLDRYPEIRIDVGVSDRDIDLVADNVDCVIRGGRVTDTTLDLTKPSAARAGSHAQRRVTVERFGTPKHPRHLEEHHASSTISLRVRDATCRCDSRQAASRGRSRPGTSCGSTRATPT